LFLVAISRIDDLHFFDRHLLVPSVGHRADVVK
jgi:hypothetical protein